MDLEWFSVLGAAKVGAINVNCCAIWFDVVV